MNAAMPGLPSHRCLKRACRFGARERCLSLLLGIAMSPGTGCAHKGQQGSQTSSASPVKIPEVVNPGAPASFEPTMTAPSPPSSQSNFGPRVGDYQFLTLEEEPLRASSMQGLKAVWVFWPGTGEDQFHHLKMREFRALLDRLLVSRGDLVVLEFHHHHLSAQTAPRRDRSRHEHIWDPQGVTAMRLSLTELPVAIVVGPNLQLFEVVHPSSVALPDFYLQIVQALARLDAVLPPDRARHGVLRGGPQPLKPQQSRPALL